MSSGGDGVLLYTLYYPIAQTALLLLLLLPDGVESQGSGNKNIPSHQRQACDYPHFLLAQLKPTIHISNSRDSLLGNQAIAAPIHPVEEEEEKEEEELQSNSRRSQEEEKAPEKTVYNG